MNRAIPYILLFFAAVTECFAQNDFRKSFADFSASSRQQFKDYSDDAGREFSKALQENWNAFKVFDAQVRIPLKPVSDTLIPACPVENVQIDVTDVPVNHKKSRTVTRTTNAVSSYNLTSGSEVDEASFPFYGIKAVCRVPSGLGALTLGGISEKAVASFWSGLSGKDISPMKASMLGLRNELNLNDWAMFEFVTKLSSELFPSGSEDERAVFTVFCMNHLGLNCKVARADSSLIPLFASEQEIYGRKYVVVDGVKFYLAGPDKNISRLNTYSVEMQGASANLDMNVMSNPKIGDGHVSLRTVSSSVLKDSFSLPIDNSLISFYQNYPQLDVNVYAEAEPDGKFSGAIVGSIKPRLAGKSGVEALNILLAFVQKDFRYRTDTDQFGKEKPYFCEENFYYPYNDCEDRAVLFSYLVRTLLHCDCLLLEYSDHVNCAVRIGEETDGYFVRRGESKYYVCDPTCQGAKVGMSGKNYRIKPQKIWVL